MTTADARAGLGPWVKPTIVGELVTLRPYRAQDADAVWEMIHDVEGNDLTATTAAFTREQIDAWAASRADASGRLDLVIEDNDSGQFAGEVVLNEPVIEAGVAASANFRIALRGSAWYGRGLGSEATALLVDHAFVSVGLERLTLEVLARNPRAIRAYEKAGFVESGRRHDEGEEWVDMELTRTRWNAAVAGR
ncbi:GNAT family N-acetyltransferase [Demequina sp. NBRC 110053]|uniref:GNAT family N-acetyltransferase n=1 Tax=Demequina sp. NBRC 110053 TaxID=1570342 RepID=UPI000A03BCCD|nr:GNAT family protein [Demequina sp. NBRC 110053]